MKISNKITKNENLYLELGNDPKNQIESMFILYVCKRGRRKYFESIRIVFWIT